MRKYVSPQNTNVHFSIETNAVLLSEEIINILYDQKIGLGISIDGYKAIHNLQRVFVDGRGSHEIVEKNFLLAKNDMGNGWGRLQQLQSIMLHIVNKFWSILFIP